MGSLDVDIEKNRRIREELKNSFPSLDIRSIPSTPTVLHDKSLGDSLKDLSKCMETQMDKVNILMKMLNDKESNQRLELF